MKRIILSLAVIISVTVSASAINLKDAFKKLSDMPGVEVRDDINVPVISDIIKDGKLAFVENLSQSEIKKTGDLLYKILNEVPLKDMINGGTNNKVAVFIYTTPVNADRWDILLVAMNRQKGSILVFYGNVSDAARNAIQESNMNMQGDNFSIESEEVPNEGCLKISAS